MGHLPHDKRQTGVPAEYEYSKGRQSQGAILKKANRQLQRTSRMYLGDATTRQPVTAVSREVLAYNEVNARAIPRPALQPRAVARSSNFRLGKVDIL